MCLLRCFASLHPALLTFYIPAGLLTLFDAIVCVQIGFFQLNPSTCHPLDRADDDPMPAVTKARLLPSINSRTQRLDRTYVISSTALSSVILVFGLSTWLTGAAAAVATDERQTGAQFAFYRTMFSGLYLVCSSSFGLLLVVASCRRDVSDFRSRTRTECSIRPDALDPMSSSDTRCHRQSSSLVDLLPRRQRCHCWRQFDELRVGKTAVDRVDRCETLRRHTLRSASQCHRTRHDKTTTGFRHCCRRDDVIEIICDRRGSTSSGPVVAMPSICCERPEARHETSTRNYTPSHAVANIKTASSPLPLLDLRTALTMTSSSSVAMATARTGANGCWPDAIARHSCQCDGCSLVYPHSTDGSTERTMSRNSRRMRDFDDEATISGDMSEYDATPDNIAVDMRSTTSGCNYYSALHSGPGNTHDPIASCRHRDAESDRGSCTSGLSGRAIPRPPPCTDNESSSSSSDDRSPTVVTRRRLHRPVMTSSSRSRWRQATVAFCDEHVDRTRRHRCDRCVDESSSSERSGRRRSGKLRRPAAGSNSSSSGLGVDRRHRRKPRSRSTTTCDTGNRLIRDENCCAPTSAIDCPPPTPSSDYFRYEPEVDCRRPTEKSTEKKMVDTYY